jgi:hypothetical protein
MKCNKTHGYESLESKITYLKQPLSNVVDPNFGASEQLLAVAALLSLDSPPPPQPHSNAEQNKVKKTS